MKARKDNMFINKKNRYKTRAIADKLHMEIQVLLWNLIDYQQEAGEQLDYLQVFELKKRHNKQLIIHRQEEPAREREYTVTLEHGSPVNLTVWCIDDGSHETMLLPSDY